MATAVAPRFGRPNDPNRMDTLAIQSLLTPIAFGAAVEIPKPVRQAYVHYIDFAQLTGAQTVNATNISATSGVDFVDGDTLYLLFNCDGTSRTVTWGTNIRAGVAATMVLPISGTGIAKAMYFNGKITILSQSVAAT